jgi:3-deoxy-D-manno-octulosonic-acid transferase
MPMWFRGVYSLIWVFALPFAFARLWLRGDKNPDYRKQWRERIGGVGTRLPADVWIHAVSVGEARACATIANALISQNKRLVITCTTPTGRVALRELFGNKVSIRYLPFDAPFLVTRFLRATRPKIGILMETEMWPGLCDSAQREGIALWLVNARLSERSARGYARGRGLTRAMFGCLAGVAAQSPAHAERFAEIGARNVHVLGNLKFDLQIPEFLQQRADSLTEHITGGVASRPYWIAGSTREGEDAMILSALAKHPLRERALAVIVPRHKERWESAYALALRLGFHVVKRTDSAIAPDCEVVIGDSMGEMLTYYANSKVCVMGGTLGGTGGQNLIEPCALGVPVVLGPSIYNFQQAADESIAAGAAKKARNAHEALTIVLEFLDDEFHRKRVGAKARGFVAAHRGATERTLNLLGLAG